MKRLTLVILLSGLYLAAFSQEKTLSGKVTDEKGDALAGVTVTVKAGSKSTISDLNGRFEIKASAGDILEFSMVGMKREQITVGAAAEINVRLVPAEISLKDVIITAYGRKKEKLKLGYSAQNLDGADRKSVV